MSQSNVAIVLVVREGSTPHDEGVEGMQGQESNQPTTIESESSEQEAPATEERLG